MIVVHNYGGKMEEKRNLTDDDVEALVSALERSIVQRFQVNVGRGLLSLIWKWVITGAFMLAAYGAGGGFRKWGA